MVRSILILLNRQEIFKGDLSALQQYALSWMINYDNDEKIAFEKIRAVNTGLATNPATSRDFIMGILEEQQEEYVTEDKWTTPRSVEEIEQFLKTNVPV